MSIVRGGSGSQQVFHEFAVTKNEVREIATPPTPGWYRLVSNEDMYIYIDDPLGTSIPVLVTASVPERFKLQEDVTIYATAVTTTGDVNITRIKSPPNG